MARRCPDTSPTREGRRTKNPRWLTLCKCWCPIAAATRRPATARGAAGAAPGRQTTHCAFKPQRGLCQCPRWGFHSFPRPKFQGRRCVCPWLRQIGPLAHKRNANWRRVGLVWKNDDPSLALSHSIIDASRRTVTQQSIDDVPIKKRAPAALATRCPLDCWRAARGHLTRQSFTSSPCSLSFGPSTACPSTAWAHYEQPMLLPQLWQR